MKNIALIIIISCTVLGQAWSQQDAQYTQFMFNKLYFNPAYAGSKGGLALSGIYRQQWIGMQGAPRTQTFNVHAPVLNQRLGLGLSITNDVIGFSNMWNMESSYAYRIPVGDASYFSLGLRGSVNYIQLRWDRADPTQTVDGSIPGANASKLLPNFGFGMYYDAPKYYVGFSIPHLFNSKIDFSNNNTTGIEPRLKRHYFLMGGLILPISKNVKFQPSLMMKYVPNTPFDIDANFSFVFMDRFLAGVTYRLGDSVDGMIQYAINEQFKIAFSYDYTLSKLQKYNSGSIEMMLEYCFVPKDSKLNNPRFF